MLTDKCALESTGLRIKHCFQPAYLEKVGQQLKMIIHILRSRKPRI
jgi:hypothetical protein